MFGGEVLCLQVWRLCGRAEGRQWLSCEPVGEGQKVLSTGLKIQVAGERSGRHAGLRRCAGLGGSPFVEVELGGEMEEGGPLFRGDVTGRDEPSFDGGERLAESPSRRPCQSFEPQGTCPRARWRGLGGVLLLWLLRLERIRQAGEAEGGSGELSQGELHPAARVQELAV